MRTRHPAGLAASLLLAAALGGCGLFSSGSGDSKADAAAPAETAAACPTVAVLRPLARTAVFGPARTPPRPRNGQDVAFYGILSDATATCTSEAGGVRVKLDNVLIGERGPAAKGDAVDLDYFVAVTGPGQSIISKKPFSVHIGFDGTQKRAGVTDHIEQVIPLNGMKVGDLTVVVAFQQTPEVTAFFQRGGSGGAR